MIEPSSNSSGTFLSDAIYKWRGIDQWPEAEATVWSCGWVPDTENGGGWYNVTFSYRGNGEMQEGSFRSNAPESSSPYFRGDTFTLRHNPSRPSRFYIAGDRSRASLLLVFLALGMGAAVMLISLFRG